MTLSFWKVMFSAQEVLDLVADCRDDASREEFPGLRYFEERFAEQAEQRSRE